MGATETLNQTRGGGPIQKTSKPVIKKISSSEMEAVMVEDSFKCIYSRLISEANDISSEINVYWTTFSAARDGESDSVIFEGFLTSFVADL